MNIREFVKQFAHSFDEIKSDFNKEYEDVLKNEDVWLSNLEDKTHLLNSESDKNAIDDIISKLKIPSYKFTDDDIDSLSIFTKRLNTIIRIANRINNFKQGTKLDDGSTLNLPDLFNEFKQSDKLVTVDLALNGNLVNFLPHLYSVVKHCQNPLQYPIYYKYWKNILREVLNKPDDYDSLCHFYRTFPEDRRHLQFAAYLGAIGMLIIQGLNSEETDIEKDTPEYKYLTNEVVNIERYYSVLELNQSSTVNEPKEDISTKYYLVGAYWKGGDDPDQTDRFLRNGVWENGYDDKFLEEVKSVEVGSKIAIKSVFTRNKSESVMAIKARGVVTGNPKDGKILEVDWESNLNTFEVDFTGGHWSTISEVTNEEHIQKIWHKELAEGTGDAKWKKLVDVVSKIDEESAVRKFFATVKYVINEFDLSLNDEIMYASSIRNYVQFTIGSRYVTHLERKKGKVIQGFYVDIAHLDELTANLPNLEVSDKAVPPEEGEMTWVYMEAKNVNVEDFFEGIVALASRAIKDKVDAKSQYRFRYPDKHNPWIAKVALNEDLLEKLLIGEKMPAQQKKSEVNYPLNTIFYGPPGTGKTYNTIKRAAEIVEGRKIENYKDAKEIFHNHLGKEIEFITFHQNYSYEDFIQGLRPDLEGGDQLSFKKSTGVFKRLSDRALKNFDESRKAPHALNKKKAFEEALETLKEQILDSGDQVRINETAYFIGVEDDAFRYSADNWTLGGKGFNGFRMKYSDLLHFFENDVKERKDIKDLNDVSGLAKQHASYFFKTYEIINDLMSDTKSLSESVTERNFVLIIDEINRANISRVFGELITLIEPDKRYGRELHIPAQLPSGETFSVPKNLYIIGTMNTADKSIALLDIALRRRFEFEAMYPCKGVDLKLIHDKKILDAINDKIEISKGHDFKIGHSYFMDKEDDEYRFPETINKKVIPLLLEYFMNDGKEVRDILNYAGLKIKEGKNVWPLEITDRA